MTKTNINNLSKKELVQIVANLQNKYSIESQEIEESRIDYHALLEATSDVIFYLDKEGNIQYINSSWRAYYPSFGDKTLGGHFTKNIPEIEIERASHVFGEVINKGAVFEDELMKTSDEKGDPVYFNASFSPLKSEDGEVIGLIGIMKNITDRHLMSKRLKANTKILEEKVKEQLQQSEELRNLRDLNDDIISNAPFGIFMMDPSGIVLKENQALKNIMGRRPDQTLVGVNLLDYKGFVESGFGQLVKKCLNEKKTVKQSSIPYSSYSGRDALIINVTADPMFDSNGSVDKVVIMVEDFTEQASIAKKATKAEKLSALGLLASGVASELRNHVNNMVMDLNFVDNNLDPDSPAAEYVDALQDELVMIKDISEQLVSLSGTSEDEMEIVELNKIVSAHPVEVMINRMTSDGFEIDVSLSDRNPCVKASPNQLYQLLIQFLENAEEAMPDKGKISIVIDTMKTESGKFAILTVEDTGIGIPEENFKRIFQPFFTTKGKKATGLGLMITSAIIENLGGNIGIKSTPGEGTSIRVLLPISEKKF